MLNNLYRKLHILFASSVMLIITLVISFVVANTVHTEKINESTLFQRLTTLLIYQVESASSDMDKELKAYEESYHIFSLISDTKGNTIYQSNFPFPTPTDNLLHDVEKQISTQPLSQTENSTTSQGGFLEIRGTHHDTYFVIPATIRTANDTVYHATFFYQTASLTDILQKTLPIYLLIWFLACIVVIVLTRYLLKKSFAPTERILQSQKDFVATASHELKTPVTELNATLENMILGIGEYRDYETYLPKCKEITEQLGDMIRDILNASRLQTQGNNEPCSNFSLRTLLTELCEPYRLIAEAKGIKFKIELSSDAFVYLPEGRLKKAISNILSNAVNYTEAGQSISVVFDKNKLSVSNECSVLPPEQLQHIFEPFYRPDLAHSQATGGNGLGLYIVQKILDKLRLKYQFVPMPNDRGMSFTIQF